MKPPRTLLTVSWLAGLVLASAIASGAPVSADDHTTGLDGRAWSPHPVAYPVDRTTVDPRAASMPAGASTVRGVVTVTPERSVALWLDPLEVVRVRVVESRDPGRLRFHRVVGSERPGGARAVIHEPGIPVEPGVWYLAQPPGDGAVWTITADAAPDDESDAGVSLAVEAPRDRSGRLIWESARRAVLRWVDRDSDRPPPLPEQSGLTAIRATLLADRAIARALRHAAPDDRDLHRATTLWRQASALRHLALVTPAVAPYARVSWLTEQLTGSDARLSLTSGRPHDRPHRPIDRDAQSWSLDLDGPGALRVEAHALLDADQGSARAPGAPLVVTVASGERTLGRSARRPYAQKRRRSAPPEAFPDRAVEAIDTGQVLGPKQRLTIPLYPGRHRYTLSVSGGPMALRLSAVRRRPWAREALGQGPGIADLTARARRLLGVAPSPAARLLDALIAAVDGSPPGDRSVTGPGERAILAPGERLSPSLTAVYAVALARIGRARKWARGAGRERLEELVSRLAAAPESPAPDLPRAVASALAWHAGAELAPALAEEGASSLARRLLRGMPRPIPSSLLATIAESLPDATLLEQDRSRMIGLMHRAWRQAPGDRDVRARYRALWRERSSWRRLTPHASRRRVPARDALHWLEPARDTASRPTGAWSELPIGRSLTLRAPVAASDPARLARLRLALSTPAARPGPVTVTIDGQDFTAIPVESSELWTFAVTPGDHELAITAPAGSRIQSELPPTQPGPTRGAFLRKRAWALSSAGRAVRYSLPAAHVGGPVRVQLRAAIADGPRVSAIKLISDVGPTTRLRVSWGETDDATVVLSGASRLSQTLSFVWHPPAGARSMWLASDDPTAIFATVALRRPKTGPTAGAAANHAAAVRPGQTGNQPGGQPAAPRDRPPMPRTGDRDAAVLAGIAELSRQIDERDPDPALLLARSHALLDLGFIDLARRDALRLTAGQDDQAGDGTRARDIADLIERLDDLREPAHLPASSQLAGASAWAVSPASLALSPAPDPALVAIVARARSHESPASVTTDAGASAGEDAAISDLAAVEAALADLDRSDAPETPRARYLHARLLERRGDLAPAIAGFSALAVDTGHWQVATEAAAAFVRAAERGDSLPRGLAALVHGITRSEAPVTLPAMRRALLLSSAVTTWSAIRATEAAAGYERTAVEPNPEKLRPRTRVRHALIAPPWPHESAHDLAPGRSAVLKLTLRSSAALAADLWCRQLDLGARPGPCRVRIRVDGEPVHDRVIPLRQITRYESRSLAPGPHRVEVTLADSAPGHRLSVRFASDRALPDSSPLDHSGPGPIHPIPIRKPATAFSATPQRPVTATVLGPAALLVEARTDPRRPTGSLEVAIRSTTGDGDQHDYRLAVDSTPDPRAMLRQGRRGAPRSLGHTTTLVIPLAGHGAHRVTLRPDAGIAYLRLWLRQDRDRDIPTIPAFRRPEQAVDHELIPWPQEQPFAIIDAITEIPPRARATWSLTATAQRDDVIERDVEDEGDGGSDDDGGNNASSVHGELRIDWRRQVRPSALWLRAGGLVRWRGDDDLVTGGRSDLTARRLPLGLRADAGLTGFVQNLSTGAAWRLRSSLTLGRSWRLANDLAVVPELSARASLLSLAPGDPGTVSPPDAESPDDLDPEVYNEYIADHRLAVQPGVRLRWTPFQDHIARLALHAVSNPDLGSIDRVQTTLGWVALLHVTRQRSVVVRLGYRPSYRLADDHRPAAYARHDLDAAIELGLWRGDHGRAVLQGRIATRIGSPLGRRDIFLIGLRYDLTRGRGLHDLAPDEHEFADPIGHRDWITEGMP